MQTTTHPEHIQRQFGQLEAERRSREQRILTQEDRAAQVKDGEILQKASDYTSEIIFKALADLQARFGQSIEGISKSMDDEVAKLDHLERAVEVQQRQLKALNDIRVAAEMLNIGEQEHTLAIQALDDQLANHQKQLDEERREHSQTLARQRQAFDEEQQKRAEQKAKQRTLEEEQYSYERQSRLASEQDQFKAQERSIKKTLEDQGLEKQKDWDRRRGLLAKEADKYREYQQIVAERETKLDDAKKKAREAGVKEVMDDAKADAELYAKEVEASKKALETKLQLIKNTNEQRRQRIEALNNQLQEASKEARSLALTAVTTAGGVRDGRVGA
ncbi:MAG: hypothetical protein ACFCBW_22815 [Candidatus Competibacterales bacterium]